MPPPSPFNNKEKYVHRLALLHFNKSIPSYCLLPNLYPPFDGMGFLTCSHQYYCLLNASSVFHSDKNFFDSFLILPYMSNIAIGCQVVKMV
jgi:hypothetical protein